MSGGWFRPLLAGASWRDRLVAAIGALLGIAWTGLLSSWLAGAPGLLLAAPIGASAVLVFAVPASPLAQPWPVIGGNIVSALCGIAAATWIGHGWFAAAVAVSSAILAMSALRCLHAPGGGTALVPMLGGPAVLAHGAAFAVLPVGLNAVLLVATGWVFHRLSGHSYPHRPVRVAQPARPILPEDIDAALAEAHEPFDIDRDDLLALLTAAERHAEARRGR